jgi:phage protein D
MTAFATLSDESLGRARGFYVPRFEVTIDGVSLDNRVVRDVIEITYKDKVDEIDGFEMVVGNWDPSRNRYKYMGSEGDRHSREDAAVRELETLFEPCQKKVQLRLGYGSELTEVMTGTFTTMEPTFSSGGPHTLAIRALNVLHKLRRKKYDDKWHLTTDSAIAESFRGKVDPKLPGQDRRRIPMPIETAPLEEPEIVFVGQKSEYDIDFLWRRARLRSYVVEIRKRPETDEDFLYFGPSNTRGPVSYDLAWGSGLVDLKVTLTTAHQVKQVTVHGWDRARQKAIEETVDWTDRELRRLNPNLADLVMQCDPREDRVVTLPVFTRNEAREAARDILKGNAQELVKVQGTTIGLPALRAGSRILLSNIGSRLSGEYYVTDTTHSFNQSGYMTKFGARREDPDTGLAQ